MGAKRRKVIVNHYAGWLSDRNVNLQNKDLNVDLIDPDIPPSKFWDHYIRARKPIILQGHPTDPDWQATALWTDAYLTSKAGGAPVKVEYRGNANESYGRGQKLDATFADVIAKVAAGDPSWYLTTQEARPAVDGHPELWAPPVSLLAGDIPLRPQLMGNLVPQQINIWMGFAPDGASSGLHHDFHDNVYVVLRGTKRFRLYPPSAAEVMKTHGKLMMVYPNGRIVYQSQGDVLSDGSHAGEVKAWREKHKAEKELAAAEQAVERGEKGSHSRLAAVESAMDALLESALDGYFDGLHDDFEELENPMGAPNASTPPSEGEPESFSRIDLSLPDRRLKQQFPSFPGAAAAIECEVHAGHCLYLPAGWFHEVTSWGDCKVGGAGHLALNYWFHPPDNLDPKADGFTKPYTSDYWPEVWAAREERYKEQQKKAKGGAGARKDEARKSKGKSNREHAPYIDNNVGAHEGMMVPPAAGEPTRGMRAQALRHLRGLFGIGRRQHLHRFIKVRARGSGPVPDDNVEEY